MGISLAINFSRTSAAWKPRIDVPHIYIWSPFYALRGANEDWNSGRVTLLLETDVFGKGQDTAAMIADLCQRHPDDMRIEQDHHLRDVSPFVTA